MVLSTITFFLSRPKFYLVSVWGMILFRFVSGVEKGSCFVLACLVILVV